jgi:PAS domain S-box-containing protein
MSTDSEHTQDELEGRASSEEERELREATLRNVQSIFLARQRAEKELREAKEELEHSHQRVTRILDSLTDGFVVLDHEWRYAYLNHRADEILSPIGKGRDQILGKSHWEIFPELVGTPLEERYRRAVSENIPVEFENYYEPLQKWFHIRLYPSSEGLTIFFLDITEQYQNQEKLRITSDRLRAIFNHAAVGIAIARMDGRFLEMNQKFISILGYSREELQELSFRDITHAEDLHTTNEHVERLLRDQIQDYSIEKRYIKKGGQTIWSLTTVTLLRDLTGKPERFLGVIEDITPKKFAEEKFRRSEEQLRTITNSIPALISYVDRDLRYQFINAEYQRWFGKPESEVLGHRMEEVLGAEAVRTLLPYLNRALSGETVRFELEAPYQSGARWINGYYIPAYEEGSEKVRGIHILVLDVTERKIAEKSLRESEEFNRSIIRSSRDCIKTLSLDGVLLWMSDRGRAALRLHDTGSILGKPYVDFWDESLKPTVLAAIQEAARGGSGHFVGWLDVQGRRTWWDVLITPIMDRGAKPERLLASSRDITERREAEELARRNEEQLIQMADSIPHLAWMAEPDGHIYWYNKRWYEYTGTNLEQMRGWGWEAVHHPEVLPTVMDGWKESLRTGTPFEMEFPLRSADGEYRWFLTRASPLRDSEGRVIRWFGTNTDVDAVRKARQALEEETRTLELLNQTGAKIASNLDLQTLLQTVTDAATQLSGAKFGAFFYTGKGEDGEAFTLYTLSGAPREAFDKFGTPRATPLFRPTFHGEGVIRYDDILTHPNYGKIAPHHGMPKGHLPVRSYLAVPVTSRSGETIGGLFFGHPEAGVFTERAERLVVGISGQAAIAIDNARLYQDAQREISVRKQVETELNEAQLKLSAHAKELEEEVARRTAHLNESIRSLEGVCYTIAHDLRAPLRAVEGYTSAILEDYASSFDDEGRRIAGRIMDSARRMDMLIHDLLAFARLSHSDLPHIELNLNTLINQVLGQLSHEISARGAVFKVEPLPLVRANPTLLEQIFSNLFTNSMKFVPEGTTPRVRIWSEDVEKGGEKFIRVLVQDNGIGIPPAYRERVFGIFQRLHSDEKRYPGTGVGLAIVRKGMERMGGSVGILDSEEGTRFHLDFKSST